MVPGGRQARPYSSLPPAERTRETVVRGQTSGVGKAPWKRRREISQEICGRARERPGLLDSCI